jgi:hypothetical protein
MTEAGNNLTNTQMTTETITPELVTEEVSLVVKSSGIAQDSALTLHQSFQSLFSQAKEIITESKKITVTDSAQKLNIKLAREYRLALRKVRTDSEKTKKELKEDSLRRGRAIDGFHNILLHIVEPEEARLDEQEKFIERQEAARKEALKAERTAKLSEIQIDGAFYNLGEMPDDAFSQLLESSKIAYQAKKDAAAKAEAEKIAREAAEAEAREKMRIENERMKREAFEREKQINEERNRAAAEQRAKDEAARKEREELQKKMNEEKAKADALRKEQEEKAHKEREAFEAALKTQREAREKAEREALAAKLEAARIEQLKADAELAEKKKAAAAPDKAKIQSVAQSIRSIEIPDMVTENGKAARAQIMAQVDKFAAWLEAKADELETK